VIDPGQTIISRGAKPGMGKLEMRKWEIVLMEMGIYFIE